MPEPTSCTRSIVLRCALSMLLLGCAAEPDSGRRTGAAGQNDSAGAGASAPGDMTANEAAGEAGAQSQLACPASNLTRPCSCDDGAPGRQICIQTSGWGGCDCGAAVTTGNGDLHTALATPPANTNAAITFEDYVMPKVINPDDCKPGNYVGTFQCFYTGPLSTEPFEINGLVSFALDRSANSEVLEIRDGLLDGWGFVFFFAYLTGDLSCATGDLSGTADEGFYNPLLKGCSGMAGDMPGVNCVITDKSDPGYMPWTNVLEGTYGGSLDPSTDTIEGTWAMMPTDIGGSCDGTFSVTLAP